MSSLINYRKMPLFQLFSDTSKDDGNYFNRMECFTRLIDEGTSKSKREYEYIERFRENVPKLFHFQFLVYLMEVGKLTLEDVEDFEQVEQSRQQIKEGKSKRFKNVEEYLKSLGDDQ